MNYRVLTGLSTKTTILSLSVRSLSTDQNILKFNKWIVMKIQIEMIEFWC